MNRGFWARVCSIFLLAILWSPTSIQAQPWRDYSIYIDGEFQIAAMGGIRTCLFNENYGKILICPDFKNPTYGPIRYYYVEEDAIYFKTAGIEWIDRGDTPDRAEADDRIEHYFIVEKETFKVEGPMPRPDFVERVGRKAGYIEWRVPQNPDYVIMYRPFQVFVINKDLAHLIVASVLLLAGLIVLELILLALRTTVRLVRRRTR